MRSLAFGVQVKQVKVVAVDAMDVQLSAEVMSLGPGITQRSWYDNGSGNTWLETALAIQSKSIPVLLICK
jgi:hypothetical protein